MKDDMVYKTKFFNLFISSILVLSILTGVVVSLDDEGQSTILVVTEDDIDKERLFELDLDILDSYGNYNLVDADEKDVELLHDEGFEVDRLEEKDLLHINGKEYDVKKDLEKYIVKETSTSDHHKDEKDLFLVQMIGPVNPEWREKLEDSNVDILNYIPNYAYLVQMNYDNVNKIKGLFFVERVISYGSSFKFDDNLVPGLVKINFIESSNDIREIESSDVKILSGSVSRDSFTISAQIEDINSLKKIAERNDVYSITSYKPNKLMSELSSQIIGGFWNSTYPSTPYRGKGNFGAYVNQIEYTGKNVTIAIADTGLGNGNTGDAGHNDFTGRVIGGYNYGYFDDWSDGYGHGTHVAGIAAGDTYHGNNLTYDGHGPYYLAQGLAYDSDIYAEKIFSDSGSWIGPENEIYSLLQKAKRDGDVYVHSNSWGEDSGDGVYDYRDSDFDKGVRDADSIKPGNQPMIVVVSAGNNGNNGFQTIASPGNGKNVITIGATSNYMPDASSYGYLGSNPDDPDEIFSQSSRGWTVDDRVKPTVVAPGEAVLSTSTPLEGGNNMYGLYSEDSRYEWSTGTSQATPIGSGASSVIVDYYRERYGKTPSPAMVKSLMINSAEGLEVDHDNDGDTDYIPNKYEGWGRINLVPICDPGTKVITKDQESLLTTGEIDTFDIGYYDSNKPLKITLTWTDKEAQSGEDPALKNDLDLEITAPNGDVYRGNAFSQGYTPPDTYTISDFDIDSDGDDDTNVVENIFIPAGELQKGTYSVRVIGESISADSNNDGKANQDYSLTMYNGNIVSSDGVVKLDREIYNVDDTVNITVEDRDLTNETVPVNISSTTEPNEKEIYLDKIDYGIYRGSIQISDQSGEGELQVSDGDEIIVSYYDNNIGNGESEIKTATAYVDGSPPNISDKIILTKFASRIEIDTDERCTAVINYGKTRSMDNSVNSFELKENHTFLVDDLKPGTTYYYEIICTDRVGNRLIDNNSGDLYKFRSNVMDDFEEGNIGWNSTSQWQLLTLQNDQMNESWICGNGDYGTEWYEVLTSPVIDLKGWDEAQLSLYHEYDFEEYRDGGIVQIKNESGWHTVVPSKGYDGKLNYGIGNELFGKDAFTGEQNWTTDEISLNKSVFDEEFRFRFIMGTDDTDTDDFGWVIDHVEVNGTISPIPNFTYEPEYPYTSDTIKFTDESTDEDGKIVNWTWEFGDGNKSYQKNATHNYSDDGEYTVNLEIADDFGIKRNISKGIYVSNEKPTANFTINRSVIRSGDLIQFEDRSYDSDGEIVNWTWDFGDGNRSYTENPVHRYIRDDNYLVELKVEDDDGSIAHKMKSINVKNGFPRAKFNYTPISNITVKDIVQFEDLSEDIDGTITNWTWDFDDGHVSYLENPEYRFSDNGNYDVSVTVRDDDGAENTIEKKIFVQNMKPLPDFKYLPAEPSTSNIIKFTDKSSDPDGEIVEWNWDFGDGISSKLQDPKHQYSDNGTYVIEFSVTDDDGSVSTITNRIMVTNQPPQANFTYGYKNDETSRVIFFYANCTDHDGEVVNWTWYFEDGGIKYGKNIKHKFDSAGKHDVELVIRDDDGESCSIEKIIKIEEETIDIGLILILSGITAGVLVVGYILWYLKENYKDL